MSRRFHWILPLLLGAGITSLFWWRSTLPTYVHGGLQDQEGLSMEGTAEGSTRPNPSALLPSENEQRTQATTNDRVAPQEASAQVRQDRPGDSARLRVRLVDASGGHGLSGVRVLAYLEHQPSGEMRTTRSSEGKRGSLDWSPQSDDQGFVEFDLPPRQAIRVSVRPDPNTHQPVLERVPSLEPFEQRDLELRIPSVAYTPFYGAIRNRSTGQPIHGARIRLLSTSELEVGALEALQTPPSPNASDIQGRFQVDASERGSLAFVQAPECGPTLIALDAAHSDPKNPRDLYVSPGSWLSVYLRDHRGGPLAATEVTLTATSLALVQSESEAVPYAAVVWRGTTNRFGRVEFDGLPADTPLNLRIQPNDDRVVTPPPAQILSPGEAREWVWKVGGGTRLYGSLFTEEAVSLAGQELWLLAATAPGSKLATGDDQARALHKTYSDPAGKFEFSGVPAGSWWITPASKGTTTQLAPLARRYEVSADLEALEVRMEVFRPQWVAGKVLTPDGQAAKHEQVWLRSIDVPSVLMEWTQEDGSFRIGPLAKGLCEVGVYASPGHVGSVPLVCTAGDSKLKIQLTDATRMVALLTPRHGAPLAPVDRILLTHPDGHVSEELNLEWTGLARGNYGVCVLTQDRLVAVAHRVVPSAGLHSGEALLDLDQGATIEFTGPGQYMLWQEGTCVGRGEVEAGKTVTEVVPRGALRLERPDRTTPSEPLEASASETVHVDLSRASTGPGLAPRVGNKVGPPRR